MIDLVDSSMLAFLRSEVPLPADDFDIIFEAPDSGWSEQVDKPTVNLFLWDLRANTEERQSGRRTVEVDGSHVRHLPMPRVDCRYVVTAWTGDVAEEHSLLGSVLGALLVSGRIPAESIAEGVISEPPPTLKVESSDSRGHTGFWSALGAKPRPAVDVLVTATFERETVEAGPPVTTYRLDVTDKDVDGADSSRSLVGGEPGSEPGTPVISEAEETAVDEHGRYVIRAGSEDEIVVEDSKGSRS